jgi:tripartite-type tricarboxylate transporter receptor subunit TctC
MLFDSVPTMTSTIKGGLVRALATTGGTRSAILPDVPTFDEAGVPGFRATLWVGFMAPAGTPKPIVELLNREITKIVSRRDIKEAWEKTGAVPVTMTQPEFKTFMEFEIAKWAKIIEDNHIPVIN